MITEAEITATVAPGISLILNGEGLLLVTDTADIFFPIDDLPGLLSTIPVMLAARGQAIEKLLEIDLIEVSAP